VLYAAAAAVPCLLDHLGEGDLKQLLLGKGVSLSSQFRLTYSMMLNLLRVEDLKVNSNTLC
jgi:antiviral helicase SKI2